jgi:hypothetical protein
MGLTVRDAITNKLSCLGIIKGNLMLLCSLFLFVKDAARCNELTEALYIQSISF